MLGQISVAVFTFGLSIALANLFSQQDYGVYKFILSVAALIGAIRLTGINQAVIQATARGYYRTVIAASRLNTRWSVIPFVLYVGVACYYLYNDNILLAAGILIAGTGTLLVSIFGIYGSYLIGVEKYKTHSIDVTCVSLINVVSIFCTLLFTQNILYVILAGALATVIPYMALGAYRLRSITPTDTIDTQALTFAKHLSVQNVLSVAANHVDKVLLFQRIGGVELAIYAFAIAIPEQARGILKNALSIITPKYAQLNVAALHRSIKQKIIQLTLLMLIPIGGYILLAPTLYNILFPQYTDAVLYSQLYMSSLITLPATGLIMAYFNVQQRSAILYKHSLIHNVLQLIFSIVCIIILGVAGAVLALILSRFTNMGILAYLYHQDRSTHS